jgi:hypothetical protein
LRAAWRAVLPVNSDSPSLSSRRTYVLFSPKSRTVAPLVASSA